jgi:hypothetical protein
MNSVFGASYNRCITIADAPPPPLQIAAKYQLLHIASLTYTNVAILLLKYIHQSYYKPRSRSTKKC